MRIAMKISGALIVVACWGCEAAAPSNSTSASSAGAPPPPTPAAPAEGGAAAAPAASETPASETPEAETPEAPADDANVERAAVGVGAKGRDYGGPGFVTTPVETFFRTGDRIAFEIQIPNAMKIYKAEHNNKGPKTHEEFMDIIIKENAVQLPELPAGDSFLYDPKTEELMVKHPTGK